MILVTGSTGLVGSHLLLELVQAKKPVRALHRKSSDLEPVKRVFSYRRSQKEADELFRSIQWHESDILDVPSLEEAFEGITEVYHCAALVSFDPSDYKRLRKINIQGTANVANFCIKNRVRKLCFVSSIATLDLKIGEKEITETSDWNKELNHSTYAISKYGAEMEVWRASQEGIAVVMVNPGVIIGPGFWKTGSGVMFTKIWNGLKYSFPKVTGFVGVKDVVKAMQQLMDSPVKNEQYILVSENISFRNIFKMAADSLGKSAPTKQLYPWMIKVGWTFEWFLTLFGRKRRLTRASSKTLFTETFYNSSKIKEEMDFAFEPIPEVIRETGEIFKGEVTR